MSILSASSSSTAATSAATISSVPVLSEEQRKAGVLAISKGRQIIENIFREKNVDKGMQETAVELHRNELNSLNARITSAESAVAKLTEEETKFAALTSQVQSDKAQLNSWSTAIKSKSGTLSAEPYFNLDNLQFLTTKFNEIIRGQPPIQQRAKELEALKAKNISADIARQNEELTKLRELASEQQVRLASEEHSLHTLQGQIKTFQTTMDAADVGIRILQSSSPVSTIPYKQGLQIIRLMSGEISSAQNALNDLPNKIEMWRKENEGIHIAECEEYLKQRAKYDNAEATLNSLKQKINVQTTLLTSKTEAVAKQQAIVTEKEASFNKWDVMKKSFNWTDEDMRSDRHYKDSETQTKNARKVLTALQGEKEGVKHQVETLTASARTEEAKMGAAREAMNLLETRKITAAIAQKIIGERANFDAQRANAEKRVADLEACKDAINAVSASAPRTESPPMPPFSPASSVRRKKSVSFAAVNTLTVQVNYNPSKPLIEAPLEEGEISPESPRRRLSPPLTPMRSTRAYLEGHRKELKRKRDEGELEVFSSTPPSVSSSPASSSSLSTQDDPPAKRVRTTDRENPTVVPPQNGHSANGRKK